MARGLHRWTSLTIKLKYKNKAYKKWKVGQETWEEYGDTKHAERELWKSKAIWSQIWSGTWRATRIISIGNQQQKSSSRKHGPLLNGAEDVVVQDMIVANILIAFFASVFTAQSGLHESQVPVAGSVRSRNIYSPWRRDKVFSTVLTDRTRSNGHKLKCRKFTSNIRFYFFFFPPWRYSKPDRTPTWEACSEHKARLDTQFEHFITYLALRYTSVHLSASSL